jgi:voltage-gated potassium channel
MEELAKKYKYPYYIQAEPHTEEAMLKAHLSSAKGLDNVVEFYVG